MDREKSRQPPNISLFLLTENRLLRDTLARLLRKRPEISVVGVSRGSVGVKDEIIASSCEIVLTDCFENNQPTTFLCDLVNSEPGIKILLFGMSADTEAFLQAVHLGICGYLLKDASAGEIVGAVCAASRGEAICAPIMCATLLGYLSKKKQEDLFPLEDNCFRRTLTPRQVQLMRLVGTGLTNKEIAARLNLSEFTVKNHLRRIMRQVNADNRHEAVALIREQGGFISNSETELISANPETRR
jgi:DNA-binding NarL/FixJ family response regulator